MRLLVVLLYLIRCSLELVPNDIDQENSLRKYKPAEPCQPDICRAPDCKCSSTESGGSFPVERTPQV